MWELSNHIRERSNWWEEVKYEIIVERWRKEALQREEEGGEEPSKRLTPTMVNFCYLRTAAAPSSP